MAKSLMKDTSDPKYEHRARMVKQFEAEYGEDWDDTLMVGYDNDFVSLPVYVVRAAKGGTGRNLRILLQWLGEANIKARLTQSAKVLGTWGYFILQLIPNNAI